MGLLENGMKTTLGGLAIGVGLAVVMPIVVPILASIIKPLTKAVIKEGLILYKASQETMTETKEMVEDLVAEAKSEIALSARVTEKTKKASPRTKKAAPRTSYPIAKTIMNEGKALYDKGKGAITGAKETMVQLVEEAKSEIAASAAAKET